ncbi:MAG: hypothetical protein MHPSP_004252, partial [Paramarteilia canceri]
QQETKTERVIHKSSTKMAIDNEKNFGNIFKEVKFNYNEIEDSTIKNQSSSTFSSIFMKNSEKRKSLSASLNPDNYNIQSKDFKDTSEDKNSENNATGSNINKSKDSFKRDKIESQDLNKAENYQQSKRSKINLKDENSSSLEIKVAELNQSLQNALNKAVEADPSAVLVSLFDDYKAKLDKMILENY